MDEIIKAGLFSMLFAVGFIIIYKRAEYEKHIISKLLIYNFIGNSYFAYDKIVFPFGLLAFIYLWKSSQTINKRAKFSSVSLGMLMFIINIYFWDPLYNL